jgi:catalase
MGYSPDKMLQARLISYPDAHRYRLGVNFEALPVNRPKCPVNTYNRDGLMRFDENGGDGPNYEPNSFGGPVENHRFIELRYSAQGEIGRYDHREGNDDYSQAGDLYRLLSTEQRDHLIHNIVGHMTGIPERIQRLQVSHFAKADPEYGRRVADGLKLKVEAGELVGAK